MWTLEPYQTDRLPMRICRKIGEVKISYSLRMKCDTAYPYTLEYYYQDPTTDEEEIPFQSFGSTEYEAIDKMVENLKKVGICK